MKVQRKIGDNVMRNKQITFLLDTIIVNRQHSYTMNLFSILR
jgi:hypothetical protein